MLKKGYFGYIIGKKKRLMKVDSDADLLWKILVREIYILMKQFCTMDKLKEVFENIEIVKKDKIPSKKQKEKIKYFADVEVGWKNTDNWSTLMKYCQGSYINLLEAGNIINEKSEKSENTKLLGYVFILNFNNSIVQFCYEEKELANATIEEIMLFEDMPTKTYTEIITEIKMNFDHFDTDMNTLEEELCKMMETKENAKKQCAINIEEKIDKLIDNIIWKKKSLILSQRIFYNRLLQLNLIEE